MVFHITDVFPAPGPSAVPGASALAFTDDREAKGLPQNNRQHNRGDKRGLRAGAQREQKKGSPLARAPRLRVELDSALENQLRGELQEPRVAGEHLVGTQEVHVPGSEIVGDCIATGSAGLVR